MSVFREEIIKNYILHKFLFLYLTRDCKEINYGLWTKFITKKT